MAFAEPQFELSEEDLDERTHVIAIAGEIHVSTAPRFSVLLDEADRPRQDGGGARPQRGRVHRLDRPLGAAQRAAPRDAPARAHGARRAPTRPCCACSRSRAWTRPSTSTPAARPRSARCARRKASRRAVGDEDLGQRHAAVLALAVLEQGDHVPPGDGGAVERVHDLRARAVRRRGSGSPGAAPGSRSCSTSRSARGSAPGRAATPRSRTSWPRSRRGRRRRC